MIRECEIHEFALADRAVAALFRAAEIGRFAAALDGDDVPWSTQVRGEATDEVLAWARSSAGR
ncbi:hypothetical protein [Micromonospora sp. NPDC048898]|uniref:hypothetical protein n=1 Tax=Micromonospora sp. NPDC048898 TaxID=3364260 RepID=UPI00371A3840